MAKVNYAEYELKKDFNAPNAKTDKDGKVIFQLFKQGTVVRGVVRNIQDSKVPLVPCAIVDHNFVIPLEYLKKTKDLSFDAQEEAEAKEVGSENAIDVKDVPKKQLDDIQKIANKNLVKEVRKTTKATQNGAIVGMLVGMGYAMIKGKSVLMFGLIGVVGGGILATMLASGKTKMSQKEVAEKSKESDEKADKNAQKIAD